jgi:hypothetical protein
MEPRILVTVLTATLLAIGLPACSKGSSQLTPSEAGENNASEASASNRDWEFRVFSFQLAIVGRFNDAPLGALQFDVSPDSFTTGVQRITSEGWEYQGVVHTTSNLENNLTYVLFRRHR